MSNGPETLRQVRKMETLKRLADNALTPASKRRISEALQQTFSNFVWGN